MVQSKGSLAYPPSAAEEGIEGTVRLKVLVTESGEVSRVSVVQSSGDERLDRAATDWVRRWKYLPAVQDGTPRAVETYAKVTFKLN